MRYNCTSFGKFFVFYKKMKKNKLKAIVKNNSLKEILEMNAFERH